MKKSIILISFLLLLVSMSAASAFLFWPDNYECEQFSITSVDGFNTPVSDDFPNSISLISNRDEKPKIFKISEVAPSSHLPVDLNLTDNYTEGDLKIIEGYVPGNGNCTCAEFDKDGHHFFVKIWYINGKGKLNFAEDVELIKEIKQSLKPKEVEKIEYDDDFFDLKVKLDFF